MYIYIYIYYGSTVETYKDMGKGKLTISYI